MLQFKESEVVKYECTHCGSEFVPKVEYPVQCPRCGVSYVSVKGAHGFRVMSAVGRPVNNNVGISPRVKRFHNNSADIDKPLEFREPNITLYRCNRCGHVWKPRIDDTLVYCPGCKVDFRNLSEIDYYDVSDECGKFRDDEEVEDDVVVCKTDKREL